MAGIYLHIPFCRQACHYCDFHFSTNQSNKNELVSAMADEITFRKSYLDEEVSTIYFGGGTPSLLDPRQLELLLNRVYTNFRVSPNAEITLEANPDDLTAGNLDAMASVGINRLSIGIQSFDDNVLRFLNRAHDARSAAECVDQARNAGFSNISIDLIYAIPSQENSQWIANVSKGLALRPQHISAYSLTIEERTVFGNWSAKGKLVPPSEDLSAEQFDILIDLMATAGYEHYEISNFALPGYYSRHNTSYWQQKKYLGIGPSAHSYNISTRQHNVSNNHQYLASLKKGEIPFSIEVLTPEDQINDIILTSLRTSWGIDLAKLRKDFNYDLLTLRSNYISILLDKDLTLLENDHLKLTRTGKFMADKISADLFVGN